MALLSLAFDFSSVFGFDFSSALALDLSSVLGFDLSSTLALVLGFSSAFALDFSSLGFGLSAFALDLSSILAFGFSSLALPSLASFLSMVFLRAGLVQASRTCLCSQKASHLSFQLA